MFKMCVVLSDPTFRVNMKRTNIYIMDVSHEQVLGWLIGYLIEGCPWNNMIRFRCRKWSQLYLQCTVSAEVTNYAFAN